jgi:hypothetical protein
MSIIEYHEGCGDFKGCFGPRNGWITLFDVNLGFFLFLLFFGLMLSLLTYQVLNKYKRFENRKYIRYIICGLIISLIVTIGRLIFIEFTGNILY